MTDDFENRYSTSDWLWSKWDPDTAFPDDFDGYDARRAALREADKHMLGMEFEDGSDFDQMLQATYLQGAKDALARVALKMGWNPSEMGDAFDGLEPIKPDDLARLSKAASPARPSQEPSADALPPSAPEPPA